MNRACEGASVAAHLMHHLPITEHDARQWAPLQDGGLALKSFSIDGS